MRVKIRPLGLGGSRAPSTSRAATAAATSDSKNTDAGSCAGDLRHSAISQNAFASRSIVRFGHNQSSNCTRGSTECLRRFGSIEARNCRRWRAPSSRTPRSASTRNSCANGPSFPSCACCNWPPAARSGAWTPCAVGSLDPLVPALTAATSRKVIHSARQDLEAFYLSVKRVISPVFDTQIAAGCIGLKPQIGYAELVKTLLDVTLPKGQTRTDWSKRPLTREQLEYAADDVLYLGEIADRLTERLRALGREHWVSEDCLALEDPRLYEPDPAQAWTRLRGLTAAAAGDRARARGASRFGARGWRASAICRAAGSFPTRRSSISPRSIRCPARSSRPRTRCRNR